MGEGAQPVSDEIDQLLQRMWDDQWIEPTEIRMHPSIFFSVLRRLISKRRFRRVRGRMRAKARVAGRMPLPEPPQ